MGKRTNAKSFIVVFSFLLILIFFYGDDAGNAEAYKEDGLLLLDAFEMSNITVDRTVLNYNAVLNTYKEYSELTDLKNEVGETVFTRSNFNLRV